MRLRQPPAAVSCLARFVSKTLEAVGFFALVSVLWVVAGDEVVEVSARSGELYGGRHRDFEYV